MKLALLTVNWQFHKPTEKAVHVSEDGQMPNSRLHCLFSAIFELSLNNRNIVEAHGAETKKGLVKWKTKKDLTPTHIGRSLHKCSLNLKKAERES